MKIGTDGVVLGSWTRLPNKGNILDVGTGTGLVALMAAQRSGCHIVGVEIDDVAAQEARMNVESSPWRDRVDIVNDDFVNFASSTSLRFNLIVSNPPYFYTGLKAAASRGVARHGGALNYESLISLGSKLLTDDGEMSIIAPCDEFDNICYYSTLARLNLIERLNIVTRANRQPLRVICRLSKINAPFSNDTLTITDEEGNFTDEYKALTSDFYLNF